MVGARRPAGAAAARLRAWICGAATGAHGRRARVPARAEPPAARGASARRRPRPRQSPAAKSDGVRTTGAPAGARGRAQNGRVRFGAGEVVASTRAGAGSSRSRRRSHAGARTLRSSDMRGRSCVPRFCSALPMLLEAEATNASTSPYLTRARRGRRRTARRGVRRVRGGSLSVRVARRPRGQTRRVVAREKVAGSGAVVPVRAGLLDGSRRVRCTGGRHRNFASALAPTINRHHCAPIKILKSPAAGRARRSRRLVGSRGGRA